MASGRIISAAVAVALAGCCAAPPAPVEKVIRPTAPAELLAPIAGPSLPLFVSPDNSEASAALTPATEAELRRIIADMLDRLDAWRAWAQTLPAE